MKFIPQNSKIISNSNEIIAADLIKTNKINYFLLEFTELYECADFFLKEGLQFGIAGVINGFLERDIPPLAKRYRNAYSETVKDITETWNCLRDELCDIELWKIESYEYGIKMAYYTEWNLDSKDICF